MDIKRLQHLAGAEIQGVQDDNLKDAVVSLFRDNRVTQQEIEHLSTKFNVDHKKLTQITFDILSSLLKGVGKHKDVSDSKFDKHQLELGVKVEQEHTDDPYIAKLIAKDHLVELPDYYDRLKKMEKT